MGRVRVVFQALRDDRETESETLADMDTSGGVEEEVIRTAVKKVMDAIMSMRGNQQAHWAAEKFQGQVVSSPEPEPKRESANFGSSGDIAIKFGKHKGTKLKDLPKDYLQWLSDKSTNEFIKKHATKVLAGE